MNVSRQKDGFLKYFPSIWFGEFQLCHHIHVVNTEDYSIESHADRSFAQPDNQALLLILTNQKYIYSKSFLRQV